MYNPLRLPYSICLWLLKLSAAIYCHAEVWPRHSYVTANFEPLKSDLDISVYLKSHKQRLKYKKLHAFFKKIFPFLGEYNLYDETVLNYFRTHEMNPFEAGRDPILIKNYLPELQNTKYTKNHALVFLQRTFINDYENLKDSKNIRFKKWSGIFNYLNKELIERQVLKVPIDIIPYNIARAVSTGIIYLSNFQDEKEAALERLNFMFSIELSLYYKNYQWTDSVLKQFKYLIIYFPEYVCPYQPNISEVPFEFISIMLEEINWLTMNNLRRACDQDSVKKGIKDTEQFINLLQHLRNQFPLPKLEQNLEKLIRAKQILDSLSSDNNC